MKCPGQDMRFWKPEDVFNAPCPICGRELEFWKDEPSRICPGCGKKVVNRRVELGCKKWCEYANACLAPDEDRNASP
jgi:hypothetical protein